jgi:ribosome-interacting GTPase 1
MKKHEKIIIGGGVEVIDNIVKEIYRSKDIIQAEVNNIEHLCHSLYDELAVIRVYTDTRRKS